MKRYNELFMGAVLIAVLVIGVMFGVLIDYSNNNNQSITISQQTELMTESWQEVVIIQDCKVLYSGAVDELDANLLDKEVIEVANCEDSFAITLFIK